MELVPNQVYEFTSEHESPPKMVEGTASVYAKNGDRWLVEIAGMQPGPRPSAYRVEKKVEKKIE
jgi:hypothetical protein